MTWVTITGAGTTTATKFHGDAMNKISNMFNGTDVSDTVTIHANVTWTFKDGAFILRDSADDHSYTIRTSDIGGNYNLTLPVITSNDTVATVGLANAWGTVNQNIAATGKWQEAGVSISPIGTQDQFVPATAMWPRTTGGCAALAQSETTNYYVNYWSLDFDQTTEENAQFEWVLPRNYDGGTVTITPHWTASTGSGGVVWGFKGVAISNDEPLDATTGFGTEVTSTDTLLATGDEHVGPQTSAITIAGSPADSDFVVFNIARKVDNGSDTLTGDAKLLGITIEYTLDAATST